MSNLPLLPEFIELTTRIFILKLGKEVSQFQNIPDNAESKLAEAIRLFLAKYNIKDPLR